MTTDTTNIDPQSLTPTTPASKTSSPSIISVTKNGNVYVPRIPPEGGSYSIGNGKAYFIPKVGTIAEVYNAHPTTPTEVAVSERQQATANNSDVYTQYTSTADVQARLQNIAEHQVQAQTQTPFPTLNPNNKTENINNILDWARTNNVNPAMIRTIQQETPRADTQFGMFGGGSVSPTDTSIIGRAGMLFGTTTQSLAQTGREIEGQVELIPFGKDFLQALNLTDYYISAPFKSFASGISDISKGTQEAINLGEATFGVVQNKFPFVSSVNYLPQSAVVKDIPLYLDTATLLIPKTTTDVALLVAGYEAFRYAPALTSTLFTGLGAYGMTKAETTPQFLASGFVTFGGATGLLGSGYLADTFTKLKYGSEFRPLAEFDVKPFYKESIGQDVYMRRFEGFKFTELRSYVETLKGYKVGQFVERQYRVIPVEVQAKYFGGGTSAYQKTSTGEFEYLPIKTTLFPYAPPEEHLTFFAERSFKEFGINKLTGVNMEEVKGFGYHATTSKLGVGEKEYQLFFSGKGVSARFLRLSGEEEVPKGLDIFNLKKAETPNIIAGAFKNIKLETPFKEAKVTTDFGEAKQYFFKGKGIESDKGVLTITKYKKEVEGVYRGGEIETAKNRFYFNLGGRKVFVSERLYGKDLSVETKGLLNAGKTIGEITSKRESYLPSIEKQGRISSYSFKSSSESINPSKSSLPSYKSFGSSSSATSSSKAGSSISQSFKSFGSSTSSNVPSKSPASSYNYNKEVEKLFSPASSTSRTSNPREKQFRGFADYYSQDNKRRLKKGKQKARAREDLALTPSFTAQILHLTKTIKAGDISKELNKFRSGADYRPVLRIK